MTFFRGATAVSNQQQHYCCSFCICIILVRKRLPENAVVRVRCTSTCHSSANHRNSGVVMRHVRSPLYYRTHGPTGERRSRRPSAVVVSQIMPTIRTFHYCVLVLCAWCGTAAAVSCMMYHVQYSTTIACFYIFYNSTRTLYYYCTAVRIYSSTRYFVYIISHHTFIIRVHTKYVRSTSYVHIVHILYHTAWRVRVLLAQRVYVLLYHILILVHEYSDWHLV